MEESGVPRGVWEGEAKAVQQCLTDIFTSVYTTCDIPENAIFGPCVLSHTSLYDSIAFVALKSTDKRTVPYIFRVDTSAANGSSEGLMWLRLVQSARDKEEQNLEAYIKNGQLFYRSLRRIAKDEELLVWYGKELSELLLLSSPRAPSKMNGGPPFCCLECSQRFQFEFPFVAHLRFRCAKRLPGHESSPAAVEEASPKGISSPKDPSSSSSKGQAPPPAPHRTPHYQPSAAPSDKAPKPSTDFHNLARELENSRSNTSTMTSIGGSSIGASPKSREPSGLSPEPPQGQASKAKRRSPPAEGEGPPRGRLERPIPSSPKEELVCTPQQHFRPAGSYFGLEEGGRLFGPPSPETGEAKRSAFVEVKKASRGALEGEEEKERGSPAAAGGGPHGDKPSPPQLLGPRSGASAFSTVQSSSGSGGAEERKSAFSQPARASFAAAAASSSSSSSSSSSTAAVAAAAAASAHVTQLVLGQKLSALVENGCPGGVEGASRLYPEPLGVKLAGSAGEMGAGGGGGGGGLPKQSPFLYAATTFWPKSSAAAAVAPLQLQVPSGLTLLPPSFTSLCLPAQNWCAKCNASFRMTSDLVYHMRSHHKKEYALEPLVKRRREEKLKCPICNEAFRERHHLSRHMTSHN